jgi:hypothetical protein
MYRQSSSIGIFAKNIVFNLFTQNEMEGANLAVQDCEERELWNKIHAWIL